MPATNLYFNNYSNVGEQTLIEDLIIESIKIYGIECYYMPRTLVAEDNIFGEDPLSKFEQAYNIEMYIKSVDGFDGEGDFLSRFNIEIRDEITFVVARRRWSEEIGEDQSTPVDGDGVARPAEGDLIYFPLNGKIFEVKFVEHEAVFYQLGDLQTYELRCELYEYSYEEIDTGIASIDGVVAGVYGDALLFGILAESYNPIARGVAVMDDVHKVANVNITESGLYDVPPEVTFSSPPPSRKATAVSYIDYLLEGSVDFTVTDGGRGYENPPTVTISDPPERFSRFGDNSLSGGDYGRNLDVIAYTYGTTSMWLYPEAQTNNEIFSTFISINDKSYGYFANGNIGFVSHGDVGNTAPEMLVSNTGITTTLVPEIWNNVKFVTDGNGTNSNIKVRINGVLVYSNTASNTSYFPWASGALRIGQQTNQRTSNSSYTVQSFGGYLDDLHITTIPDDFIGTVQTVKGVAKTGREAGTHVYLDFNNIRAVATANVVGGEVVSLNTINKGYGYHVDPPLITIANPPVARTANGTAILFVGGGVDHVRINDGGSGYITPPIVTFGEEQPELPYYLISEENEYIVLEEYKGANTAGAKNEAFQLEAEGKGEEPDFIDFSEFNPFSEGGKW